MQKKRHIPPATLPHFTAVPRRYRYDGWTPERQRAFIAALADTGSVKHAAARTGMSPEGAYYLRRQPGAEGFAAAWLVALDHGIRQLEDIAMERAIHGVERPVYSYGKLVGHRRDYNDRLIMFMLRNRASDRFIPSAARHTDLTGPQVDALRAQWEAERVLDDEETRKRVFAKMDEIRERLLAGQEEADAEAAEEEADYQRWCEARAQGRAVILPEAVSEGDGRAASED